MLIPTLSITPTPDPSTAELARDATQIINTWNNLGPFMAVLGIVALALIIMLLSQRSNSNSQDKTMSVLTTTLAHRDAEIIELKNDAKAFQKLHIESLEAIAEQGNRSNDISAEANKILKAQLERGNERDASQKQLADDFHVMLTTGSIPVQEILTRVRSMMEVLTRIDTRTADWNAIVQTVTPLMIELGALRTEAKKHSTQPIPAIDPPNNGEATPQ